MKNSIILFTIMLMSSSLNAQQNHQSAADSPNVRLEKLRMEVKSDLTENLLPFWSTTMVDEINGGFYGRVDYANKVYPDEDKGGILNARILWTFSSAYRILGDTSYLHIARRAKEYIMSHFIDKKYGGAYRTVTSKGDPADTRKQVYTQTFFIYGLAEYYRATGDTEALKTARDIFELFEKYALDTEQNGYFEVFSRDWQRSHDLLIGESSEKDEKTMNTHLHIMEAYTELYRVWPDDRVGARLRNLVDLFLDKIVDPNTSHLICFTDRGWNRASDTDSYGHDIESSWLLTEAASFLGDPALMSRIKDVSLNIVRAASEGLQPDGSMIYEKNSTTGRINSERSWWVQAETVTGFLNAYELTGNMDYLDTSLDCWKYIKSHMIDYEHGGWFSSVNDSGITGRGDKAGFWVCPYHNGRMCMEIVERTNSK
jgi:mannobiose 2-epimerase